MQTINKKILIVAVIFALVTTALVYSYMAYMEKPKENTENSNVVIAVKTIEKNALISPGDVKMVKMARVNVNPKSVTDMGEIVGKRAKDKIYEGEQVVLDRVMIDEKLILSYNIPQGKRAVSINVKEAVEVGDFIRPGDYVDILATFDKYEVEEGNVKTVYPRTTKVILQNILVLGMGQLMDVPEKPRTDLPKTATLAVAPDEAEKLVFSEEAGVLRMALRRVGDYNPVATQGAIRQDLVMERGKTVQAK